MQKNAEQQKIAFEAARECQTYKLQKCSSDQTNCIIERGGWPMIYSSQEIITSFFPTKKSVENIELVKCKNVA